MPARPNLTKPRPTGDRLSSECSRAWLSVPTPEELDNLDFDPDLDHAIGAIQDHVAGVERAAHDWVADTQEWGKVAKARIEAQRKTEKA